MVIPALLLFVPNDIRVQFPKIKTAFFIGMGLLGLYVLFRYLMKQKKEDRYLRQTETMTQLEPLDAVNKTQLLQIARGNIPVAYVAEVADTIAMAEYGADYGLPGLCYAIKYNGRYVGIILLERAMKDIASLAGVSSSNCFRIYGFVIDGRYQNIGIGSTALYDALQRLYAKYGKAAVIAECNTENVKAIRFFENNGFVNTGILNRSGTDCFLVLE